MSMYQKHFLRLQKNRHQILDSTTISFKILALSTSIYVVPILPISYPLTYALPCDRPNANFAC